jgi:aspartate/methionine/tyrosine aminotransferase
MKKLSDIAYNIQGQPMFQFLSKVQAMEREGHNVIHFELGEPDFDTPSNIIDSACNALRSGFTHYTSSMGLYEFREIVRDTTGFSRGFKPEIEQILVTPGANAIIYYAIKCVVNPGDEVIIPDPGFPTYFSATKACGATAVHLQLKEKNAFRLDIDELEALITDKTRLIILNTPSNPTGAALSQEEIKKVYDVAEKHDIYILSDEIYSRLIFSEDKKFCTPSVYDKCLERTIVLNGFSKAFAMTGWRIGVAIGPKEVIAKMGLLNETIVSCVPPFIQKAAIEAITGDQSKLKVMKAEYSKRKDIIVEGLNSIKGVKCLTPDGAIYVFPSIKETGLTSQQFSDIALEKAKVAVLPGTSFGLYGEGFIRLSYVTNLQNINEAIIRLRSVFGSK